MPKKKDLCYPFMDNQFKLCSFMKGTTPMAYIEHTSSKNRRKFTCIHSAVALPMEQVSEFKTDPQKQSKIIENMRMIGEKEYQQYGITCETRLKGINSYIEGIATLFNENDNPIEVFDQLVTADQMIGSTDYSLNSEIAKFVSQYVPRLQKQYKHFLFKKHQIGTPNAFCNGLIADAEKFYGKDELHKTLTLIEANCDNDIEELDLSHNKLAALPKEIGKLKKLQYLYLHNNKLTTLPKEIGKLTKLEVLDLTYNKLTTLPNEIDKLAQLEVLNLTYNKLTTLPKEIGKLTKLQYLYLYNNELATLPTSLCTKLKKEQIHTDIDWKTLCTKK